MRKKYLKCIRVLLHIAVLLLTTLPLSPVASAKDSQGNYIMVSLGDSFSSGESIEPFYGQKVGDRKDGQNILISNKVTNHDWLAHRSVLSWPGQLMLPSSTDPNRITMAPNRGANWYFVAVSGAETWNIRKYTQGKDYNKTATDEEPITYVPTYVGMGVSTTVMNVPVYRVYSGHADIRKQMEIFGEIEYGTVDYVTMTLGGNDADFVGVVGQVMFGSNYFDKKPLDKMIKRIWHKFYYDCTDEMCGAKTEEDKAFCSGKNEAIKNRLYEAYHDIAKAAGPQARIIVAGYPKLFEQTGAGKFVSKKEATLVNNAISEFNKQIGLLVEKCKEEGMKICFVSVEEDLPGDDGFDGNEAYSKNPYINKVLIGAKAEDIDEHPNPPASAYSMHPNEKGADVYRRRVQKKIDELEASDGQSEWPERATSDERDIVLVLDTSGSMSGTPIEETRKASVAFIDTILKEDASIGVVEFSSGASVVSNFSMNQFALETAVNNAWSGGGTNMDAGLKEAHEMLQSSNAKKKIIVLMSDGQPNEGRTGQV